MTQTAEQHQPRTRNIPAAVLVLSSARDKSYHSLTSTAILLYLALRELGENGNYPDICHVCGLLGTHRANVGRAEVALQESGLLTITKGKKQDTYHVNAPDTVTPVQRAAWQVMVELQTQAIASPATIAPAPAVVEVVAPAPVVDVVVLAAAIAPPPPLHPVPAPTVTVKADAAEVTEKPIKTVKLPPEVQQWFLASSENMDLYIRFGIGAYGKTRQEAEQTLKASANDWLSHKPADEVHPWEKSWSHNQYMGYYWHGVCKWRGACGIPLTFPVWSRLAGDIRNLLAKTAPNQAYSNIFYAINYFNLIRFRVGGRVGESLMLDEASLTHNLINAQILHLASHGQEWLDSEIERMNNPQPTYRRQEGN